MKTGVEHEFVDNPVTEHLRISPSVEKVCIQLLEGCGQYSRRELEQLVAVQ